MMINKILFIFCVVLQLAIASAESESVVYFCVADLSLPKGPAGYPCRNSTDLTADDFVYSAFRNPGDTNRSIFHFAATPANDVSFPALNGLGLSMARLDLAVGGSVPVHTHRVSEIIILIQGTIIAGFIGPDDTPYYKTLLPGDIMIFPQTLLHFQINVGSTPALAFVSLNSANPGFQFISRSLFGNNLPTEVVQNITLIGPQEVDRLKAIFAVTPVRSS